MTERLSTGAEILDRRLGGGIPVGRMVALTAPPDTQSELLLSELARERETIYLSTVRPADEVRAELDTSGAAVEVTRVEPTELLDDPARCLDRIERQSNVIIDPTSGLELDDRDRYLNFLNALKARLRETRSVALLHCLDADDNPPLRSLTLNCADIVWRLHLLITTLSVETRLIISKFRGGSALREPIKLLLTDRVQIDTSRDIA